MTVAELIELLKTAPQDLRVMSNAGEWGPQPISGFAVEHTRDSGQYHWINYYPELADDEDDDPREDIVLLDFKMGERQ